MVSLSRAQNCASIPKSNKNIHRKNAGGFAAQGAAMGGKTQADLRGVSGSLGNNAKCSVRTESIDRETGEIIGFKTPRDPMLSRVMRYILQSVARKALMKKSRIHGCNRWRQKGKDIQVWQSKEFKTASFSGLQTCGSVWDCPICAAKIAERRRVEIITAMTAHKAAGGCVQLLTLTAPHQRTDKLGDILEMQATALKIFNSDRAARQVFEEMGLVGSIRALEVTHGRKSQYNNGWHAHYHILQFAGVGRDLASFDDFQRKDWAARLYLRWAHSCERAGLDTPSYAHGLKLDDGSKAAAYVSKWGLEDEMTKGHTKKSAQGETPFDFLRSHLEDETDTQALFLFREFSEAFKGKRQLYWSTGLKKRFAIGEASDDELNNMMDDYAELLGTITLEQWRAVLKVEARGEVLQLAVAGGWPAVTLFLNSLQKEVKYEHSDDS